MISCGDEKKPCQRMHKGFQQETIALALTTLDFLALHMSLQLQLVLLIP
jgi:hypothetical protein